MFKLLAIHCGLLLVLSPVVWWMPGVEGGDELISKRKVEKGADSEWGNYTAEEVAYKSQLGILKLRGYAAEIHYAITKDGYHLQLVRIVNPFHPVGLELKRPVLFNHGLLESSSIWLINSRDVRPAANKHGHYCQNPTRLEAAKNGSEYVNLAMLLANNGYDVWLMSMRGTDYSLYHEILDRGNPAFWDYSLDQFALEDVPSAIDYIRRLTNSPRVGYVGHSQATFSVFGLLATRPHYAKLLEPVVAVAPVAYFDSITSVSRKLFLAFTDTTHNGPLPESAKLWRQKFERICTVSLTGSSLKVCQLVSDLIGGLGPKMPAGFFSHLPYFTSFKVVRHFGQLIKSGQFSMYDHGAEENLLRYGKREAPLYQIGKIQSKRLVLVWSRSDTISAAKDVERFISELKVPLYKRIFIDRDFNHFDLITGREASHLVNAPVFEVFEQLEARNGHCSRQAKQQQQQQQLFRDSFFNANSL